MFLLRFFLNKIQKLHLPLLWSLDPSGIYAMGFTSFASSKLGAIYLLPSIFHLLEEIKETFAFISCIFYLLPSKKRDCAWGSLSVGC
jgi:hypothetical protein